MSLSYNSWLLLWLVSSLLSLICWFLFLAGIFSHIYITYSYSLVTPLTDILEVTMRLYPLSIRYEYLTFGGWCPPKWSATVSSHFSSSYLLHTGVSYLLHIVNLGWLPIYCQLIWTDFLHSSGDDDFCALPRCYFFSAVSIFMLVFPPFCWLFMNNFPKYSTPILST